MAMSLPHSPQLPVRLEPGDLLKLESDDVIDRSIHDQQLVGVAVKNVVIRTSQLEASELTNCTFKSADVTDVVMTQCHLFGTNFDSASWLRTQLRHCLATGIILSGSLLKDHSFKNSKLNLANFRDAKLQRVTFDGCDLSEADFSRAHLTDVSFNNCSLIKTIFADATAIRLNLGNNDLSNVKGLSGFRGVTVSSVQLMQLAPLLAQEANITVAD